MKTSYLRPKGSLIEPRRFDMASLEEARRTLGEAAFEAQYQQRPMPPQGNIIKRSWLKIVDELPTAFQYVVVSADIAGSENGGDYSAFIVWGYLDGIWYVIDVYREQLNPVQLHHFFKARDSEIEPDIVAVEKNGLGMPFVARLREDGLLHVEGGLSLGDKRTRCEGITVLLEAGHVAIFRKMKLYDVFMDELLTFPSSKHDDMVDAFSFLLTHRRNILARANVYRRPKRRDLPRDFGQGLQVNIRALDLSPLHRRRR